MTNPVTASNVLMITAILLLALSIPASSLAVRIDRARRPRIGDGVDHAALDGGCHFVRVSDYRGYFVCDSNNALISPDIVKIHSGSDYEFDTWLWAQEAPMVSRYPRIELPDPFLIGHVWNGRANEKFGVAERIDWKPCQAVTDKFQPEVTKYNMEHKNKDGFEIMLTCEYSGDPKIPRKPKRKVNLTASEIEHLHGLRKIRDAAYEASEAYESYLFRVHHERQPKPGDPCFYYAGIVVDTDYLTIDPNPMFYGDDCQ